MIECGLVGARENAVGLYRGASVASGKWRPQRGRRRSAKSEGRKEDDEEEDEECAHCNEILGSRAVLSVMTC